MSAAPVREPKAKTHYIRDLSGGMNLSTGRESIADNEAWWMEGLQPVAPGNLAVLPHAQSTGFIVAEISDPTYAMSFQALGTSYIFVVFANSGNGYVGAIGGAFTQIFAGTLTSGTTCACQWNKQGILIVDPTGYWDWSVTTPAVLTALDHSVQSVDIFEPGSGYTVLPTVVFAGGGGAGAAATAYLGVGRAVVNVGGAGYKVGDQLFVLAATPRAFCQLNVDTVSGTGAVTGVSIVAPGSYTALPALVAAACTGGAGNAATVDISLNVSEIVVTTRGSGYTSAPTATLTGGGPPARQGALTANVSGSLGGTGVASYAGRAWIASGRTVIFTDAGEYASFVGSGSEFTIDDAYLVNNITGLFGANNYLYIFGDTSIDVLSNVTITAAGTASFSRVNVSAVIGCNQSQNIFAYYRSVAFANPTGFFMLTGATVENISEGKLDLFVGSGITPSRTCGFPVTLNGQLCAAWSVKATDNFIAPTTGIEIVMIYRKGRWFFSRQAVAAASFLTLRCTVSIDTANNGFQAYSFDQPIAPGKFTLYQLFKLTSIQAWRLYTKLYDMGSPMVAKQVTRAGFGFANSASGSLGTGLVLAVDTENGFGATIAPIPAATSGNQAVIATATAPGNSRYLGFHQEVASTDSKVSRPIWMALEYSESTSWQ